MVSKKVIVRNEAGIHARPAAILVQAAGTCRSDVKIIVGDKVIQAKNILNLMAAAIKCGMEIEICCDGETEKEDLEKMAGLIESGLYPEFSEFP